MSGIGNQNLRQALAQNTRRTTIGDWIVATGSTTTTIKVTKTDLSAVSLSANVINVLVNSMISFEQGANDGQYRYIGAITADGTITLDQALSNTPVAGDQFTILAQFNISVTTSENISQIGGETVAGNPIGKPGTSTPSAADQISTYPVSIGSVAEGTAATANTGVITTYTAPAHGTVNISVAIAAAGTATTFGVTLDDSHYYNFLNGQDLVVGTLSVFSIAVAKGDTINCAFGADTTIGTLRAFFVQSQ